MEIKIPRADILKALSFIQGIVEKKSTMPILHNVLFEATREGLTLTATDLEVGVVSKLAAEVGEEGRVAIHSRSIYDIVRELPESKVRISTMDNNWISIACGAAEFKIMALSPDEFPTIPTKGDGSQATIDAETLKTMIEKTAFAMSTDETRYALNGVYLEQADINGKKMLRLVATDGHRLSITEREIKSGWRFKGGVILPRKGVMELKKLIESEESGTVDLWIDQKHAIAYSGKITLVIRLIEGQFPPYSQIIPKAVKRTISVDREAAAQALRRVSVVTSGQTRGVKIAVSPKNMEIFSSNPDFGEAHEELAAQYRGDAFEIGFNAKYVLDVLNILEDQQAVLKLGDDTAPCLITSEIDPGFTHIIMPMRL